MNTLKNGFITVCIVVVGLLCLTPVSFAGEGQCGINPGEFGPGQDDSGSARHEGQGEGKVGRKSEWMNKVFDKIGVTEEQKKSLAESRKASKERSKELRAKMKASRKSLYEELKKEELDMGKINAIASETKTLSSEMVSQRLESFLSMREVLTAEQFSALMDMKSKNGEKWMKRKHERKGSQSSQE